MSAAIRPLADDDIAAAAAVIGAAFERPVDFQPMLRLHRLIEPEGFWVADDAGQIVGTVGAVDYGRLAYIALMTVEPGRQSQGLGRRLMEHALAWLGQRGCHVVLLDATEKGARLYQTMGFVDDAFAYEFVREQVASPPTANGHRIERAMLGDLPTIVAFDAPRFGAGRQKLFAALWPTLGERALVRARRQRPTGRVPVGPRFGARPLGGRQQRGRRRSAGGGARATASSAASGHAAPFERPGDRAALAPRLRRAPPVASHAPRRRRPAGHAYGPFWPGQLRARVTRLGSVSVESGRMDILVRACRLPTSHRLSMKPRGDGPSGRWCCWVAPARSLW